MKKLLASLVVAGLSMGSAWAVPVLQLYVEGATYDSDSESWVTSGQNTIRLWAIGNTDFKGTIYDVKLAVAFDKQFEDTFSISVSPTTVGGSGTYGVFTDTTTPQAPTTDGVIHYVSNDDLPKLTGGATLPPHGVYADDDTAWTEYKLGNFTENSTGIADFISSLPTSITADGQINAYDITFNGADAVHFDLYDNVIAGTKVKAKFAPFSHDAEGGGGNEVPDGGTTAVLLGLGFLGIVSFRKLR